VTTPRPLALALLALALVGCPDSPPPGDGGATPVSTATTAAPTSGSPTEAPADPLAGGVFTREEVLELFRAEHAAGARPSKDAEAARLRAFKRHRLVDDEGREVPARMRAYERAVQTLAEDADAWSEFVDSLDRP
jgi:hypothetical protein